MSASQQFQAKGFYLSACVSLVLAVLKLTEMKQWSWWRVFLPLWVIVGQNVIYVLVGFLCLFAVRYGEGEEADEPAKVQSDRIVYQVAWLACVLRHSRKPVESSIRFEDKTSAMGCMKFSGGTISHGLSNPVITATCSISISVTGDERKNRWL